MQNKMDLLAEIITNCTKIFYPRIIREIEFLTQISNNPSLLLSKLESKKRDMSEYTNFISTGNLIISSQLMIARGNKNYDDYILYLDTLISPMEYLLTSAEYTSKKKETTKDKSNQKNVSNNKIESMKDILILYKKTIEDIKTLSKKIKEIKGVKNVKGGYMDIPDGHVEFYGGKIHVSGGSAENFINRLRAQLDSLKDADDKIINEVLSTTYKTSPDELEHTIDNIKNSINKMEYLIPLLDIDTELKEQLTRYSKLGQDVSDYLHRQKNMYLDQYTPRVLKIGGGLNMTNYLSLLTEQDYEILEEMAATYITDIINLNGPKEIGDYVKNIDTNNLDMYKNRLEIKKNIKELYESIPSNIPSNLSIIIENDTVMGFSESFIKIIWEKIDDINELEHEYNKITKKISDLCDIWEKLIGPDTDTCIRHAGKILKIFLVQEILPKKIIMLKIDYDITELEKKLNINDLDIKWSNILRDDNIDWKSIKSNINLLI